MDSIESLALCKTPLETARVYNPMSPEYYLADQAKAAEQAAPKTAPETAPVANPAVKVTLSPEAQQAMKG